MSLWRRSIGLLGYMGVNVHQIAAFRHMRRFRRELRTYQRQAHGSAFDVRTGPRAPILTDYHAPAGFARGHYFHQDLWAARRIYAQRPQRHIDIGSRIDGFVAHVLVFMPVTIIDIRPLPDTVEGLTFLQGDAMNLAALPSDSVESLSSLHAIEHVGLGRYGDPVDADGWRRALHELRRVLAPGGRLYLSVPVGRERVEFNSHRVFNPLTIIEALSPAVLLGFHAVDDAERFCSDARPEDYQNAAFSCGLFEFTKA